jgi:hypothetical protein
MQSYTYKLQSSSVCEYSDNINYICIFGDINFVDIKWGNNVLGPCRTVFLYFNLLLAKYLTYIVAYMAWLRYHSLEKCYSIWK